MKNIIALMLGFAVIGCKQYLDVEPIGQIPSSNFYQTQTDAKQALIATYSPVREMISNENFARAQINDVIWADVGTDDIFKGGGSSSDGPQLIQKESYQITSSNPVVQNKWSVNYKGIQFCNIIFQRVPSIPFADTLLKRRYLAEARFLRAFYYFDLLKNFGGVPIVDAVYDNESDYNKKRSTKDEVYAFIESDLAKAINDLPSRFDAAYPKADIGSADKGAALGLRIKVAAFRNKMAEVKTYSEQLFTITGYKLTPNFGDIFQPAGEWNSESIFEINAGSFSDNRGSLMARFVSARSPAAGVGFDQISNDLRNEFEANDPRQAASFYTVTQPNYGTNWYNRKYSFTPYSLYSKANVGAAVANGPQNLRVIRLADIYLLYAESVYVTAPLVAIDYVNRVRRRARGMAGVSVVPDLASILTGQALLNAIYHERRVELAGEGHRFFDLIRTSRAAKVLASFGFKEGVNELLPLPALELSLSQGVLQQNPGY